MHSTKRQKAEARRSREMDILSDYENLDVMLGDENINSIERELASTINGSASRNDTDAFSHLRGLSSQENGIRDFLDMLG